MDEPSYLTIDAKDRIRFGPSVLDSLDWRSQLLEEKRSCWASLGASGQMLIMDDDKVSRIKAMIETNDLSPECLLEGDLEELVLAVSSMSKVSPSIEKGRITMTIPRGIRHLIPAFEPGKVVVLICVRTRFEIWDLDQWRKRIGAATERVRALDGAKFENLL